jgi:phosphopantothenoylcysteine decarboxylase/phosphopantothenate--cysteine ligase
MRPLEGKTVALCVTGSIAAYKSALVARLLVTAGAKVIPVMTISAARFLGPLTLAGICGEGVKTDMFDPSCPGEIHVELGARADAVLVVPATADVLARFAEGRADDLVTALVLCARGRVLAAPAMHPRMWEHPATRRNVEELRRLGRVAIVGPVDGPVASGDEGMGRMAEPEAIVEALAALLDRTATATATPTAPAPAPAPATATATSTPTARDLAGVKLIVTAGPTVEDLDPVRYVGNRSSGKMGFAVAERAALRGARVTLIAGPVSLATPAGVSRINVRSAVEMQKALALVLGKDLADADALVMAAAVADYRPKSVSPTKLKKTGEALQLELVANPDLLADIGRKRAGRRPFLVGFALETAKGAELVELARKKLATKRVDLVVANEAGEALSGDDNRVTMVTAERADALGVMPKMQVADLLLDEVRSALAD